MYPNPCIQNVFCFADGNSSPKKYRLKCHKVF